MDIRVLIADHDSMYLEDVKEFLDQTGRYTTKTCLVDELNNVDIKGYDAVIVPETTALSLQGDNIISMYPEFYVGKGFAKYSGKNGLIACIEHSVQKIKVCRGEAFVVAFFLAHDVIKGHRFVNKFLLQIKEQKRKVLFVNFSYSLKDLSKSNISSSDLMFYMTSSVDEKNEFINGILKSDDNWLFLNSLNSIHELFELEGKRLSQIMSGIRDIKGFEYIFIVVEPGIRRSMYRLGEETDLNVIIMQQENDLSSEIIKGADEHYRLLPVFTDTSGKQKDTADKRQYKAFYADGKESMLRRLDGIFEQTDL